MLKINFNQINDSIVKDENGKEIINFKKTKIKTKEGYYYLINSDGEKIGDIEKERYNLGIFNLPKIKIDINDEEIILNKDIKEYSNVYEIKGSNFKIKINRKGNYIELCKNNKVAAIVNIEKENLDNIYLVDILDKFSEEYILSILFAIELIGKENISSIYNKNYKYSIN